MATTWKKSKLGKQDLFIDDAGTGATVAVKKSDDSNRTVNKLNASHWPITATTRAKTLADAVAFVGVNVDTALQEIADDLLSIGTPDGSTLDATTTPGTLVVKTGGITATQLATDAVTTVKVLASNITNVKLAPTSGTAAVAGSASGASGANVIEAASIAAAEIELATITKALMANNSVGVDELDMDASGTPPVAFPVFFAEKTWDAGAVATQTITVTGALTSDTVLAMFQGTNTNGVSIESAYVSSSNTVTVVASGAAANGDIVGYFVFRATA